MSPPLNGVGGHPKGAPTLFFQTRPSECPQASFLRLPSRGGLKKIKFNFFSGGPLQYALNMLCVKGQPQIKFFTLPPSPRKMGANLIPVFLVSTHRFKGEADS